MEDKAKICRMLKPVLQETRDFKDLLELEYKQTDKAVCFLWATKFDYVSTAHKYAIATADGDVAAAIATEVRLTSAETFDVFFDEIRRKHRDEEVDWFDFTNEEVEERLSNEEKENYYEFLISLTEELKERSIEDEIEL